MTPRRVAEMVALVDSIYSTLDDGYDCVKYAAPEGLARRQRSIAENQEEVCRLFENVRELREMLAE